MKSPEIEKEEPLCTLDETLELIRGLKEDYSDEIPKQLVSGASKFRYFKVRRNWFQGVVGVLNVVEEHLEFRGGVDPEIKSFLEFYTSKEFHDQKLTTREDINRANKVLELSQKLLNEIKKSE